MICLVLWIIVFGVFNYSSNGSCLCFIVLVMSYHWLSDTAAFCILKWLRDCGNVIKKTKVMAKISAVHIHSMCWRLWVRPETRIGLCKTRMLNLYQGFPKLWQYIYPKRKQALLSLSSWEGQVAMSIFQGIRNQFPYFFR